MTDEEVEEALNVLASSYTSGSLKLIQRNLNWAEGVALWRAMIDSLIEFTADGMLMDDKVYHQAREMMRKANQGKRRRSHDN